jgi:hypothetical protein
VKSSEVYPAITRLDEHGNPTISKRVAALIKAVHHAGGRSRCCPCCGEPFPDCSDDCALVVLVRAINGGSEQ